MKAFKSILDQAFERRKKLLAVTDCLRLVNGKGDCLDGLLIDMYNKHFQVQFLNEGWDQQKDEIYRSLKDFLAVDYLIIKSRQGLAFKEEVLTGTEPCTVGQEYGIKFEVNLRDGLNCGLFLDMRKNRHMVGAFAKGKKVLNCFSYTCSFGAHARVQGAREVINTDISRKILERGKNNYQLNGLSATEGEFIKADSVSFLQRAFKKGNTFDVIILDPPSFARHEGKTFQVKRDLPKVMALAVAVLNPGGALLVTSNYSDLTHADMERILAKGLNGRRVAHIQRVGQDEDFVGSNSFKESFLVGLWVKFI